MSEGNRVMLISKHKRAKDVPAILGMKPDLQERMEVYVSKIRLQVYGGLCLPFIFFIVLLRFFEKMSDIK